MIYKSRKELEIAIYSLVIDTMNEVDYMKKNELIEEFIKNTVDTVTWLVKCEDNDEELTPQDILKGFQWMGGFDNYVKYKRN